MRCVLNIVAAGLALAVCSCGSNRPVALPETGATLEGTITYGGEPVQFAEVSVKSATGSASGRVRDGRYKIENVPLGEVMVGVNTDAATGDFRSASMAAGAYTGPQAKGKKKVDVKFVSVPAKYIKPDDSGLTTTVKKGVNSYDIVIAK